ncbi:MAG: ATP-binding cassette domain-containing protein [Pseudomonadota bacterium]
MLRVKRLKTLIIGPISFDVARSECVAVMGPSGAGKSLLLRAIVDLDPSEGAVSFNDCDRSDMPAYEWRRRVALVPAESGWWSDRVGDHFHSKEIVASLLDEIGLADALGWEVSRLSTGERQRLAIVRALCNEPQVLLLDEPTASLDMIATASIEKLIRSCCAKGMAILIVTHDRQQAQRLANRTLSISHGAVLETAGDHA